MVVKCGSGRSICQTYWCEQLIDLNYPPANTYVLVHTQPNAHKHKRVWHVKIKTADVGAGWPWTSKCELSLVFQAALISFWLSMYFTIYRSHSTLAGVPWAILSNPPLSASATLLPRRMLCILLLVRRHTQFSQTFFHHIVIQISSCEKNLSKPFKSDGPQWKLMIASFWLQPVTEPLSTTANYTHLTKHKYVTFISVQAKGSSTNRMVTNIIVSHFWVCHHSQIKMEIISYYHCSLICSDVFCMKLLVDRAEAAAVFTSST